MSKLKDLKQETTSQMDEAAADFYDVSAAYEHTTAPSLKPADPAIDQRVPDNLPPRVPGSALGD